VNCATITRSCGLVSAVVLSLFSALAAGSGRIYVYAQRSTAAHSWLAIACDDVVLARIKRGFFFAFDAPPGRHTLSVDHGVPATIEIHPGVDSYVRLDWVMEVGRPPVPVLSTVAQGECAKRDEIPVVCGRPSHRRAIGVENGPASAGHKGVAPARTRGGFSPLPGLKSAKRLLTRATRNGAHVFRATYRAATVRERVFTSGAKRSPSTRTGSVSTCLRCG
jgi:hypothetical protein